MNINNLLPTFKGTAEERPVQFLTKFEIRASTFVGQNDILLLHTIQQVLSERALIWFGQMQRSADRVHSWAEFKHKFIQKLRSDIRSRLDLDISLPIRELVRKTQTIESNIEQQKVDEKLKLAATQEKTHFTSFTTNSISFTNTNRQRAQAPLTALISSIRSNDHKGNHDQRVRNNNNASGNKHNPARTYNRSFSKEILFN
ncbi:unnamed protein product [Rotaria magnacalcarata]|uniref:Retrotransposon gag domain-containing protein n=2 Tax=Rotaria magnacalcarata TaxID=392030 RepID=A0A816QHS0_9BILA|nr:unnamed protein product [Rotaria magnacalcarata]